MPHIHDLYDFTVSFFLLHPTEEKLALHYHNNLGIWNNFGGHIELDEDPLETIQREMREETGLDPSEYTIIQTHDAPVGVGDKEMPNPFGMHRWKYGNLNHWHIDLPYLMRSKTASLRPQAGESTQTDWFDLKKIKQFHNDGLIDDGVLHICEWILNGKHVKNTAEK